MIHGLSIEGIRAIVRGTPRPVAAPAVARPDDVHGRVMITYLSAGNGHLSAAKAMEAEIKQRYPGVEVMAPVDMAHVSKAGKWAAKLFYPLLKSGFYKKFFEVSDKSATKHGVFDRLRQFLQRHTSRPFFNLVKRFQPDVVINTHLLGADLIGDARDHGKLPRGIKNFDVVTDQYGHGAYVMGHVDTTFAPSTEVARQLAGKGLDPHHIEVTGIPVNPAFSGGPSRDAARASLGLASDARVLLVQGNLVDNPEEYRSLMKQLQAAYPNGVNGRPVQVAVTAGGNEELLGKLKDLSAGYRGQVQLVPFAKLPPDQMRDLMKASDLSLTKPGGLTTAESTAMGLPMVLLDVMGGGQETYNADYFRRAGAGVVTNDFGAATAKAIGLLGRDQALEGMHQAATRIGRPDAAARIADATAAALTQS